MSYRVLIVPSAENDIRHAVRWWSENRSAEQAERWYNRICPAIATLTQNPERCPLAAETDLLPTGLWQLHFGVSRRATHRIVFTIDDQTVLVLRVRHIAQRALQVDDL